MNNLLEPLASALEEIKKKLANNISLAPDELEYFFLVNLIEEENHEQAK